MEPPTPLIAASPAPDPSGTNEPFDRVQILEATSLNVPKLKELNYSQWKLTLSDAIKEAELWGYVDGSAVRPTAANFDDYKRYKRESGAVRKTIIDSLEPGAQKYLEGTLTSREVWLALEKHYQLGDDAYLVSVEQQLAELKLAEGGDLIEHVADFCRLRRLLDGTRFAMNDQASVDMMYRSLPASYRQWTLTQEQAENGGFESLCSCLRKHYRDANQQLSAPDTSPKSVAEESPVQATVDYSDWGVPDDIKSFDLTGAKNPLLEDRAKLTCRDCLLKDHEAGTPECPQFAWRREIWGERESGDPSAIDLASGTHNATSSHAIHTKSGDIRSVYEFSEAVKVVWDFETLGLQEKLLSRIRGFKNPTEIQQCAIAPIISGRSVIAQAQSGSGKTTALAISVLQIVQRDQWEAQALVLTATEQLALRFESTIGALGSDLNLTRHACTSDMSNGGTFDKLVVRHGQQIVLGTPSRILDLIRRDILRTNTIKILVLDGADEFSDKELNDHILGVCRSLPQPVQIVAFYTTLPPQVSGIAEGVAVNPIHITVKRDEPLRIPKSTRHFFVNVERQDQRQALTRLVGNSNFRRVVVFCNTYSTVGWLQGHMGGTFVHENLRQEDREKALQGLSSQNFTLVTTETWTRGFYPQQTSTIVNYDFPSTPESYAARLGLPSGFGSKEIVINFVARGDVPRIQEIERVYGIQIPQIHLAEMGIR